jgi:hypothetical protein
LKVRIFRQRKGNFDAWRRYTVVVDGTATRKLSSLEVVEVEVAHGPHEIQMFCGSYASEALVLDSGENRALVAVTTVNPNIETPQIRAYWVSADELKQQVPRFDGPPYIGGPLSGLTQAIAATLVFLGLSVTISVGAITKGVSSPGIATVAFLVLVGGAGVLFTGFIGVSGARALFYYFRMPRDLRPTLSKRRASR